MINYKKIKTSHKSIETLVIKLQHKNLILLKGNKGYIMCGYLNLKTAEKFGEAAVVITGVSSIKEALKTNVHSLTSAAKKIGIRKGQPIAEVLKLLA